MQEIPSIFHSASLSQFVRDYSQFLRKKFGGDQVKSWAQSLGIKSRVTFHNILRGTRLLKAQELEALQHSLDMSFLEKQACLQKTADGMNAEKTFFLSEDFFATPLNTIVLNLCGISEAMTLEKIKSILGGAFAVAVVERAVLSLIAVGLIQQEGTKLIRSFEGSLSTVPGKKSISSQEYFRQTYTLADKAWELPLAVRETTAFTFRMDKADIPKLKDLVRKFRQDVAGLSAKDNYSSVYQCSVAAFPIYRADS